MAEHKHFWLRLDNAAKLYSAVRTKKWSNVFRISITLREKIDPTVLQAALAVTCKRFPSISMRLCRGFFWFYLEEIRGVPQVQAEGPYPCRPMSLSELKTCAFRVLYYENRIATEFFHSLTDGTGGLIFLKTLVAEYLLQKEKVQIPFDNGVLDPAQSPDRGETEDSFLKYQGAVASPRREATAYKIHGTREPDGLRHITTGIIRLEDILPVAQAHRVSLTAFLVSVMMYVILQMQNADVPVKHKQRAVKVMIPVNLRKYFSSSSLRNFALFVTPSIDANMGEYTLEEILQTVHHQMKVQLTKKQMQARITANVKMEQNRFLKALPLFVKNIGMKIAFSVNGEKKSCITMSNLGAVQVPAAMEPYVERLDFVLGVQNTCPNNCGIVSYGSRLYINLIRNIRESELERRFFTALVELGIPVEIESNNRM